GASGALGLVMLRLAELKEAQMRLRSKIQSGMMYPVLMMCMAVILLIGIFAFVIPRLVKIFESMRKEIPPITQFMIFTSDIVSNFWPAFIGGGFMGFWMFKRWTATPGGRARWDAMKLRFPLFGNLF